MTVLSKLTSSEWKGIVATVDERRIEWSQFQTRITKNFRPTYPLAGGTDFWLTKLANLPVAAVTVTPSRRNLET